MTRTLADSSLARPRVDPSRQPRIAVGLQDESERDAFVSLLAVGGLAVNAGATAIERIGDRVADGAADALVVVVAEPRKPEVLALVRRVRKETPAIRIVIVAADDDPTGLQARQALNAGADAFLPRRLAGRALAPAVHAAIAGLVCAPRDVRRLLAKPTFSHREKQVLGLLVAGLTNREIARQLYLAESTVKSHLMSAFAKLGVRSRKDAASLLLDPAEGLAATSLPTRAPVVGERTAPP